MRDKTDLSYCYGLSLCIQGTFEVSTTIKNCIRFIPVYTGNIDNDGARVFIGTVYPCVYREHMIMKYLLLIKDGLSLCIQGTYQL